MATVTISLPEAKIAFSIKSLDLNLPVPKNKRELNSFPAMTNFSIVLYILMYIMIDCFLRMNLSTTSSFDHNYLVVFL